MTEAFLRKLRIYSGKRRKLTILNEISGIIRPSRLTLVLGPPGLGKTTLLLALTGLLKSDLQPLTSVNMIGMWLRSVRETLDFSARCQGVGTKYDMLLELLRREKIAGVKSDEDLDIFTKALALEGTETGFVVEYILKEK